jgi:hypothetical protein
MGRKSLSEKVDAVRLIIIYRKATNTPAPTGVKRVTYTIIFFTAAFLSQGHIENV